MHKHLRHALHERFCHLVLHTGGAPLDDLLEESASPDGSNSDCSTNSKLIASRVQ